MKNLPISASFSRDDIATYFETIEEDASIANTGPDAAELEESGLLMSVADKQALIRRLQGVESYAVGEDAGDRVSFLVVQLNGPRASGAQFLWM